MNEVLLFFVFPFATIIFAIALEKILDNPILVAAIVLAIFLIVAFTAATADFLIYVIAYTILAFLTAYLVDVITDLLNKHKNDDSNDDFDLNTQACRVCRCQKQFIRNLRGL